MRVQMYNRLFDGESRDVCSEKGGLLQPLLLLLQHSFAMWVDLQAAMGHFRRSFCSGCK
jgi:hypothetical protein